MENLLFTPFRLGRMDVPNRLVCLPMYLAYADPDHLVNDLVLDFYNEMAASGVGMVVIENTTVEECGLGNPRTMLVSDDRYLPGLARLAETINRCFPGCELCMRLIIQQKPAYCGRWPKERRLAFVQRTTGDKNAQVEEVEC